MGRFSLPQIPKNLSRPGKAVYALVFEFNKGIYGGVPEVSGGKCPKLP